METAIEAQILGFENMGFNPFVMCASQDWVMENDDGGSYFQRKKIHQAVDDSCDNQTMEFLQSLSSDLQNQRLEMDLFLQFENERLRRSILEEETRQKAVLLQKYESKIKTLITQKDEEMIMARNKAIELQDFLKAAEMEVNLWKQKAIENEAIVINLNNKLNQIRENVVPTDAFSSFTGSSKSVEDGEKSEEDKMKMMMKMACKLCQVKSSCVVFFPCRHLCSCKSCDTVLGFCPVCESAKEGSLQILFC